MTIIIIYLFIHFNFWQYIFNELFFLPGNNGGNIFAFAYE